MTSCLAVRWPRAQAYFQTKPNPSGANPLVAERALWRSWQSRLTGGQQPIGNPYRFLSFLLHTWTTPVRPQQSFVGKGEAENTDPHTNYAVKNATACGHLMAGCAKCYVSILCILTVKREPPC